MSARLATVSRQLGRLVGVSIFLSIAILACSMVHVGVTSFWLSEAGFVFTIIHHFIILHNQRKRKQVNQLHSESSPIAVSSRKPAIFIAWFTALIYTAALGIVIYYVYLMFSGSLEEGWDSRYIATVFEAVFLALEVPLMIMIALWCMRERRAALGAPDHAKWYHLPQYRNCESTSSFPRVIVDLAMLNRIAVFPSIPRRSKHCSG
jgi:hypothetical protein